MVLGAPDGPAPGAGARSGRGVAGGEGGGGGKFAGPLEHDRLHVALLVPEVVEEHLERRVRDLQLGCRQLEPERRLVPRDEVLLFGHAVAPRHRSTGMWVDSTPAAPSWLRRVH